LIVLALLSPRWRDHSAVGLATSEAVGPGDTADSATANRARHRPRRSSSAPVLTAEQIVADKVGQFTRNRRPNQWITGAPPRNNCFPIPNLPTRLRCV